ncbi:MAG: hypothetical protein IKY15_02605, partial [Clostridia bacterium]|nr:hypothetical protein [Clostridia bacterium]
LAYRAIDASIKQNFCIDDYLTTNTQRVTSLIGSNYTMGFSLRSGYTNKHHVSIVNAAGGVQAGNLDCTFGVRPAMVMRLQ